MEWENHVKEVEQVSVGMGIGEQAQAQQQEMNMVNGNGINIGGGLYVNVKVMTDEQMEVLRRQISIYATICEQLVEMHKAVTAQQDIAGLRLGNLYCDPLMGTCGHKLTARQRWTPTPVQLQILERLFDEGNGTPNKQKIKEITNELGQHGQISETNVYNWFQNRRARSKRKQAAPSPNEDQPQLHMQSQATDDQVFIDQSPKDRKTRSAEDSQFSDQMRPKNMCLQTPEIIGLDQFIGKMEVPLPGCYSPYFQGEGSYM